MTLTLENVIIISKLKYILLNYKIFKGKSDNFSLVLGIAFSIFGCLYEGVFMLQNTSIEFAYWLLQSYAGWCKPFCQEVGIPQTAFDILMFLANNPAYNTARDIAEMRKIKANLISVNVDKLVCEGYLIREPAPDDRRVTLLKCTEKAQTIIDRGHKLQSEFYAELFKDIDEKSRIDFLNTMGKIAKNIDGILAGGGDE